MNPVARDLRRMARYIRKNGFSPQLDTTEGCHCFCGAERQLFAYSTNVFDTGRGIAWTHLSPIVGDLGGDSLIRNGWTGPECTQDAAAACDIAADIAEASHA